MKILKIPNRPPVRLVKDYTSVGYGTEYDVALTGGKSGIVFSVQASRDGHTIIPGDEKIRVDGRTVRDPEPLRDCARIEWPRGEALYLEAALTGAAPVEGAGSLAILSSLARDLGASVPIPEALGSALVAMAELAGAESGAILCESATSAEWDLVASVGSPWAISSERPIGDTRKFLVSHGLLDRAIRSRETIFIDSIAGHDLEKRASILASRVFSCACLPLALGDAPPIGALFLHTHTPGRALRSQVLGDLKILATQAALLLSTLRPRGGRSTSAPSASTGNLLYVPSVGNPMVSVAERLQKLALHDLSLLIVGETGTGKEVVAKEIHDRSPRSKGPFVALNCAAIPPSLMESMLFGYVKGAFTGANDNRTGKFEQASGGTLFLDEIGDLPAELQTKLLRVLQEKSVEPLGSHESRPVDVRILAATHQDLTLHVVEGKFRQDLFYRLNGATIALPALRDRGREDIELLAKVFLSRLAPQLVFGARALDKLAEHGWPGNVRELEQVVRRAAALAESDEITVEDLELTELAMPSRAASLAPTGPGLKSAKEKATQEMLHRALAEAGGNRSLAAKILGVSERTLYRLLSADASDTRVADRGMRGASTPSLGDPN